MVNQVLQDKTEATALAATDLLHIVNDPSGTPVDKKITFTNVQASDWTFTGAVDLSGASSVTFATGTFTPVLADDPTAGNAATSTATGRYTKIGDCVFYHIQLLNINTSGLSGLTYVRGLPFAADGFAVGSVKQTGCDSTDGNIMANVIDSGSYMILYDGTTTGATGYDPADISSTSDDLYITGFYFV